MSGNLNTFSEYFEDLTDDQLILLGWPQCNEWRTAHDDEAQTLYAKFGIIGCVYDDPGNQSGRGQVYVPLLESARPGSGNFWRWLREFEAMHAPKEIVFVLTQWRLEASLAEAGYRCISPEEAYEPSEAVPS